jgi:hypothetical protein
MGTISGCQSFHTDTDADGILFSSDEVLIPLLIQEKAQWEISKKLPSTDETLIFKFGHSYSERVIIPSFLPPK